MTQRCAHVTYTSWTPRACRSRRCARAGHTYRVTSPDGAKVVDIIACADHRPEGPHSWTVTRIEP